MLSYQIQNFFFWTAAYVANIAAVNPNVVKTLLASNLSTFLIKGKQVFSNGSKSLLKNPPDFPIFCNWVFDNFILAEEPFARTLRSIETCVSINSTLFSLLESPTTFDESFKVTSLPFFVLDFNTFIKLRIRQF